MLKLTLKELKVLQTALEEHILNKEDDLKKIHDVEKDPLYSEKIKFAKNTLIKLENTELL